jgi:hypothetical protein
MCSLSSREVRPLAENYSRKIKVSVIIMGRSPLCALGSKSHVLGSSSKKWVFNNLLHDD